jgi:hypothetical protein
MITFFVQKSEWDMHSYERTYWLRADEPNKAAMMAITLWKFWEKKDSEERFPRYEDRAESVVIDEGDWKEALRECRHMKRFIFAGRNPEAPMAFSFIPDGW